MRVKVLGSDDEYMWDQIVQIMPCPRKMWACYWDSINDKIIRIDVEFLALIQKVDGGDILTGVEAMILTDGGFEEADDGSIDYLGIEADGFKWDWSGQIEVKKARLNRNT